MAEDLIPRLQALCQQWRTRFKDGPAWHLSCEHAAALDRLLEDVRPASDAHEVKPGIYVAERSSSIFQPRGADVPPAHPDVLDSLHLIFTRHGIASRTMSEGLVSDVVQWAADACRQSKMPPPQLPNGFEGMMVRPGEVIRSRRPPPQPSGRRVIERCYELIIGAQVRQEKAERARDLQEARELLEKALSTAPPEPGEDA